MINRRAETDCKIVLKKELPAYSCFNLSAIDQVGQKVTVNDIADFTVNNVATEILFAKNIVNSKFANSIKTNNLQQIQKIINERLANKELVKSVIGALLFLEDTQVRDRPGMRSSEFDATDVGDGACSELNFNVPASGKTLNIPLLPCLKIHNKVGEWSSDVHFLPKRLGLQGQTVISVPDSNMFMTAAIAYPLFLLQESSKNNNAKGNIEAMLQLALDNIKSFKRGEAYSFWSELPGVKSKEPRVGPLNLPVELLDVLEGLPKIPVLGRIWEFMLSGLDIPQDEWTKRLYDPKENPYGGDAVFNIPNDADDTATAVATQWLYAQNRNASSNKVDIPALKRMAEFRDLNRTKEDGRDAWKGKNTGAFLTWMKDENEPVFAKPREGVMPLDVNNVDSVVNANVIFTLSLCGQKETSGYKSAIKTVVKAIQKNIWDKGGLYYPQHMMFPYAISRAYRDGGADDPELKEALKTLLTQILDERDMLAAPRPHLKGAFPGGKDSTYDLSTALGITTLLNLGRDLAKEACEEERYNKALDEGVKYLLEHSKPYGIRNPETKDTGLWSILKSLDENNSSLEPTGSTWQSGLFFAASFHDLAQWRSQAYTTAIALEALTKYLLCYDESGVNITSSRKLILSDPAVNISALKF